MPLFYEQFTAWISIDGCVADEYGVRVVNGDHDNGDGNSGDGGKGGIKEMGRGGNVPRVECWIPSVEGKTFTIHWTDSVRTTATDGIVRVDGKECGGKVLSPHKPESDACKVGWRISATEVRPFVFAKVGLTDDDTLAFPDVLHPHLGEIQIDIHKAIITTMSTEFNALEAQAQAIASEITNEDQNSTSTLTTVVHEKTKKMIEHHTRFGKPLSSARPAVRVTREPDSEPVVRFLFRYRSLGTC
ncbi:hypothetical protein K435DRAFT_506624 [Dendrothele bispora CBS 962.96]|uniref:DUF7918 domain-containing protein n=1 Tax=Dendrothele bispora (strain CBS 962.96) TaxID=1314807 RepID=A0A4S8MT47_DENBC|nr:hypothetical protein K435DRAFT_506624 [Dendrothele bispora CBS 962.96]